MFITAIECQRIVDELSAMAAVMTVYYNTLINNLEPPPAMEFEYDDRKQLLKSSTLIVRLVDFDLACYPLTIASVVFYDENGNPVP